MPDKPSAIANEMKAASKPATTKRASELMGRLQECINTTADVDVMDVLWDIFADLRGSYRLTLEAKGIPADDIDDIDATISDYLVNNYGD